MTRQAHKRTAKRDDAPTPPPTVTDREPLFAKCRDLARSEAILDEFEKELRRCGVVGALDNFKILLLTMLTRLSDSPVSAVLKGGPTAGKSFTLDTVLRYTPQNAFEFLSGMSEKAIIYATVDLRHKMLCIGEFAGLQNENGNAWLRQLLTEGRLRYLVTGEDTGAGRESREIVKEGPTGLIMTTTAMQLHPEDESRLLSLYIDDSPEQTAAVLKAQAMKAQGMTGTHPNAEPWIALHEWIANGRTQVVVPFSIDLAVNVDPSNGRMKRDFPKVLELVKAHALLHQANRECDEEGRVVATLADYAAVYALLALRLAEGQTETLDEGVNEVVAAVSVLSSQHRHREGVSLHAVVEQLGGAEEPPRINKSTVSRRAQKALEQGYLIAPDRKPGSEHRLRIGKPRGRVRPVLPEPSTLKRDK